MLVGNTVGDLALLSRVSMNAGLKVGGIMTAIPYPLLGLAGGAPIAALLSIVVNRASCGVLWGLLNLSIISLKAES